MTIYVGIDLHRKRSQIAALDEQGTELLSRRVANDPEALKAILAELGGELQVALEATYGWEWLADLLEAEGHELHLSHPLRTKALARHDPRVDVLCQLRGVGPYTAMLVIAEVGEIERFRSARHLCAWAGLTPTVRSSDGRARLGHISQQGSPHIRWALVEAAQKAAMGGGPVR